MKIQPNTNFLNQHTEPTRPNWDELDRKDLEKTATFNTCCKHCKKLPQCNYINKTCKKRQTIRKAMENLTDKELVQYCIDSQEATEQIVKAMFCNIINIMVN